ncbi:MULTISPECIES: DUF2970 domain-containing protein [Alcaligenaceae]|jgi:hypothetical protein|uniref:DUF2970 domain-containing protein n=1 Tax=Neopusillimonas maritima TaxID=2026239 RepID=A0A3A1YSY3_9BURK|nr:MULTISPECIES: DUF2970 domain-containing protein [Alcaligenaceae]MBF22865.1 hypothetical protein [Pusillimonas sp.]QIM47963.1 DUF2970 domain-containing protein [Pusillimonas sp. DMV24BSW_D]RII83279.1 hypothetical protein CJO09_06670 [Neopusillimonas maritima]RIY40030.1 hypothetical protein CJP73_11815 [Neopusillimonas maritima]|tara:strand:+ start:57513 stop:57737 length:225 start_codon:yes stop_codon:yes gene_type:complete
MSNDLKELSKRKLNFFQTVKAVLWGFFGVRKGKGYNEDIERLNPVHLIIAAVIATVIFVVGLVLIAQWFVAQAV